LIAHSPRDFVSKAVKKKVGIRVACVSSKILAKKNVKK
jgi:hypothetical protein